VYKSNVVSMPLRKDMASNWRNMRCISMWNASARIARIGKRPTPLPNRSSAFCSPFCLAAGCSRLA
jgi:hypothetical protein